MTFSPSPIVISQPSAMRSRSALASRMESFVSQTTRPNRLDTIAVMTTSAPGEIQTSDTHVPPLQTLIR